MQRVLTNMTGPGEPSNWVKPIPQLNGHDLSFSLFLYLIVKVLGLCVFARSTVICLYTCIYM